MAVNVSARNLGRSGFARQVLDALEPAGVAAHRLTVEVTETALMTDPVRAASVLGEMSDAGVRVSVDDFGSGQTSLVMLADLPIAELKIDRGFVFDIVRNPAHAAIVRSIVELGHNLGLTGGGRGRGDRRGAGRGGRHRVRPRPGLLLRPPHAGRPALRPVAATRATPVSTGDRTAPDPPGPPRDGAPAPGPALRSPVDRTGGYFLDSQNMASMAAISLSRRSATATSLVFLVSPAVLVAFQNMSCRFGNFSRCSGLK